MYHNIFRYQIHIPVRDAVEKLPSKKDPSPAKYRLESESKTNYYYIKHLRSVFYTHLYCNTLRVRSQVPMFSAISTPHNTIEIKSLKNWNKLFCLLVPMYFSALRIRISTLLPTIGTLAKRMVWNR